MDRLDEVLTVALPLLRRIDEVLGSEGAPPDHALWDQLRRVRLLPGDAARAVAALHPEAFDDAVPALRADARACADVASGLPPPGDDWSGEAAEAYTDLRTRVAARLSGDEESLDERLEASADLAQALIDWMAQARAAVATALAEVLASSEALTLTTSSDPPAAADVATHVLRVVGDAYAEANDLLEGSADLEVAIPM